MQCVVVEALQMQRFVLMFYLGRFDRYAHSAILLH
jgi:hypothetical protein